jgi:hypothetical protein
MRRMLIAAAASCALALAATAPSVAAADGDSCEKISETDAAKLQNRPAVLADIDGVLSQYVLLDYGPTNSAFLDMGVAYPREDAALMMNIYLRRGYLIVYMAGRPRQMDVLGKSMCEATLDWLEANGFPTDSGDTLLLLRDGSQAVVDAKDRGTAMAEWMGEHGTDLFRSMVEGVREASTPMLSRTPFLPAAYPRRTSSPSATRASAASDTKARTPSSGQNLTPALEVTFAISSSPTCLA